jgi:TolB protein
LNTRVSLTITSIVLLLCIQGAAAPQDQIFSGLTRSGPPIIRLAIPEFRSATPGEKNEKLAKAFNDTLWADLDFSGNIELASRSFYPTGSFVLPGDIKPDDWRAPGIQAQYVAYGNVVVNNGRFSAVGRLRDLGAQQESIASNFPGFNDEEESARLAAHNFADRILETLGFGRGIARTQIAFVSNRSGTKEIYVMDYDGTNPHRVSANGTIAIAPKWSPVDDRIAYTAWRPGPQITIISASGDRHTFQQPTGVANHVPAWSPDGKSIVYSSRRDDDTEIYVADADGKNARRLTTSRGIDTSPVFNPATGRRIAFVSDRSGTPQIYTMSSDGTDVQRLTEEGGDAENPSYSPDGRMIAFAWQKPETGNFDIFIYDTTSQKFVQVTANAGNNERPVWAPDGKHIAFQSNRSGGTQIYSMTVDGKKLIQLTNTRGINEGPTWSGYATP